MNKTNRVVDYIPFSNLVAAKFCILYNSYLAGKAFTTHFTCFFLLIRKVIIRRDRNVESMNREISKVSY